MNRHTCEIHCRVLRATLLPTVGGFIGAVVVRRHIYPWYTELKKPSWTPPNFIYGPVWAALHSSIGYASYLVCRDGDGCSGPARLPLILYGTHLALNLSWAPIFFSTKCLNFGFWGSKLMTVTAIATGHAFYKINKTAGYIFIPYVLWLGFTSALMFNIYKLNKKFIRE